MIYLFYLWYYKVVVLELWMKYLLKIELAFLQKSDESKNTNYTNFQTERDKKYFEISKLKREFSAINKENETAKLESENLYNNDLVWPDFFASEKSDLNSDHIEFKNSQKETEFDRSIESSDEEAKESNEGDWNINKSRIIVNNIFYHKENACKTNMNTLLFLKYDLI